jgi:hypothetical protein
MRQSSDARQNDRQHFPRFRCGGAQVGARCSRCCRDRLVPLTTTACDRRARFRGYAAFFHTVEGHRDLERKTFVACRIHSLTGPVFGKMALLDLWVPFSGAVSLSVRRDPLLPDERVVALAYPKRHLRFAGGRFVGYGHDQQFPAAALMEIYEGDDRLVLDHGASGAPVLDCEGGS